MRGLFGTFVSLLACTVTAAREYKLVVEVARHGIRSPKPDQIFDLTVDPAKNFDKTKEKSQVLVEEGGKQHYVMGQYVRKKYGHFIGESFDPSKIYVMSTGKSRTIESAKHQLQGIYNKPFTWPAVSHEAVNSLYNTEQSLMMLDGENDDALEEEYMTVIPHGQNTLSHVDKTNCPRFTNMTKLAMKRDETKAMRDTMEAVWEKEFFPQLRELANLPNATAKELKALCTYLYWATEAKMELKFTLNDKQMRLLNTVADSKYYARHLAEPQLASLSNYEFFKQFEEFVKVTRDGVTWKDTPYFSKYFQKSNQKVKDAVKKFPQFVFYSAHAETLAPLFVGFQVPRVSRPSPGSAQFIEFFTKSKEESQVYVRAYYKKADDSEEDVMTIPGASHYESDGAVTVEDFEKFIQKTLVEYDDKKNGGVKGNLQSSCYAPIMNKERPLADPTKFHEELFAYWGVDTTEKVELLKAAPKDPKVVEEHPQTDDHHVDDIPLVIEGADAQAKLGFIWVLIGKCSGIFRWIVESIMHDLFQDEMDLITKLLVVVLFVSCCFEFLYIISPRRLKQLFVRLDRNSLLESSKSGNTATVFAVWAFVNKVQILTDPYKRQTKEQRLLFNTGSEISYKQAAHWKMEIHLYILMMITSVWMTINIQIQLYMRETEYFIKSENPDYVRITKQVEHAIVDAKAEKAGWKNKKEDLQREPAQPKSKKEKKNQ